MFTYDMPEGYTFDDVLLMPGASNFLPREADVGTRLSRRVMFMAKVELFRVPLLGQFMRAFGAFPVRRNEADLAALQRRVHEMQRNQAKLHQQLAQAQQHRGAQDATLQQARRELDQLDRKIREQQTSPTPDATTVKQLQDAQNKLVEEISRL